MKKTIICTVLALSLITVFGGCGGGAPATPAPAEPAPAAAAPAEPAPAPAEPAPAPAEPAPVVDNTVYTFKYAYQGAADLNTSLEHVVGNYLKENLESRSNGRIKVDLYAGGTMGDAEAAMQQVEIGTLQGCPASDVKLSTRFPGVQVLAIPYLFDSWDTAYKVLDGDFCAEMYDEIAKTTPYTVLGVGETGFRYLTNSAKEIKTPADMAGLKFRVMDSEIMVRMMSDLGATGIPMAYSELYTAMQTNVVHGQENPAPVIWRDHFDEVQGFMTCDGHTYTANFILVETKWFNKLPSDLQEIFRQTCKEAGALERETSQAWVGRAISEMEERNGLQVYYPTADDLALFRAATQDQAIEWLRANVDSKWLDGMMAAVEKARQ